MWAIRPMEAGDIPAAQALWQRTAGMGLGAADTPAALGRFLERNPGLSVVGEDGGRLVGTALCGHDGRRGMLYHVAVDESCRRQGLGQAMVTACLEGLARAGIGRCHLFVFTANECGIAFWEHAGWTRRDDLTAFSRDTAKAPSP